MPPGTDGYAGIAPFLHGKRFKARLVRMRRGPSEAPDVMGETRLDLLYRTRYDPGRWKATTN